MDYLGQDHNYKYKHYELQGHNLTATSTAIVLHELQNPLFILHFLVVVEVTFVVLSLSTIIVSLGLENGCPSR